VFLFRDGEPLITIGPHCNIPYVIAKGHSRFVC
jgi:hypothetical protein